MGRRIIAAGLVVCGLASRVLAQEAAATTPVPSRTIEEIVVTAQKKAESIQEVPMSISAITGDFLRSANIDDVAELVRYTPSVYFQENGPAGSAIFIRGFGTPFALSTLDPGVSLVLDELSIPRDVYLSDPLFDLERFEVLRGPQGTLFGKNTPAGLFNLTTKRPTRDWTADFSGRVGGLDSHRLEAAFGGPVGPLGDVAQFRVALLESDGIDDMENTTIPDEKSPDTRQRAVRLSLALQPLEDLDVLVIGSRAQTDATRNYSWQLRELRPSSLDFLRLYDPEIEDDPFDHQMSQDAPGDTFRDTDLVQMNVRYAIGDVGPAKNVEAVAILGHTEFEAGFKSDLDMSPADILSLPDATFIYEQRSVELRLAGELPAPAGWGSFDFILGGLLFDSEYSSSTSVLTGGDFVPWALSAAGFEGLTKQEAPGGIGFQTIQEAAAALGIMLPPGGVELLAGDGFFISAAQEMRSKAVFGQVSWHLTDQWTLSAGARANFEDKDLVVVLDCFDPGLACAAVGTGDYSAAPDRSESDISPKVSLQYFPWQELSLFATYGQGYKSGGFNNLSLTPNGLEVEPEKTQSYETGAKGTLFGDTLSYGLTLFWMDVEDLQLQNYITSTIVLVRNAASARSRGVELELQWLTPWEPLSLRANGAIADAAFKDYPNAPGPRGTIQDASGKRLPYAPQQQFSLTPDLRFPFRLPGLPWIGERDVVLASALDVNYIGDLFLDGDLDPNTKQDSYILMNARVALRNADETISLGIAVENLTDNDVMTFTTDAASFPGAYMGSQLAQRNWYLELRVAF